ncbi:IPT/TIG domain protein [Ureibacillus composti]|nr:IPT/TIG domain protein [Ureibacillus composti]
MKVGPINALNGFPLWYKDRNGLRLMLNTDPNDPFNVITPADIPNPGQPVSFPDNFPEEAFYFTAEAQMVTGTGERARLVLALEAAFVNDEPAIGEQIVFGRVRIRVAGLVAGATYIVTHPYGENTFVAEDDGDGGGEINFTQDIGGLNGGNFELATRSKIDPFLRWDPSIPPAAPSGYIGDPNILHEVIGSEVSENVFRIVGPGIGIDSPNQVGDNPDMIETRLFSVAGKISTVSGVETTRATYSQSDVTGGSIDVFAFSDPDVTPQVIEATADGVNPTILEGANGLYFARLGFVGENPPSTLTVTNKSDIPPSVSEIEPVDFITAVANYDNDTNTLTITATSSDTFRNVLLKVEDYGEGELDIPVSRITFTVPPRVTITSSEGGRVTIPVTINGSETPPTGVVANAGADQTVIIGAEVTLDGRGSSGPITGYQWVQTSGIVVELEGADTATPTFTAPNTPTPPDSPLIFELTVFGEGGPSSDSVAVEVIDEVPAPIANAGPNQTVQQGSLVTLSGSATGVVTSFQWSQISGPQVVLSNPNSPTTTFIFPRSTEPIEFQLTASGPGGSGSDTVVISTVPDNLTIDRVEFRTRDSEWRISGTSSVSGPGVTITIYLGRTLNGVILAQVPVDALGEWEYRVEPSAVQPDATRAISIKSSSGGTLLNVPINVRN